MVPPSNFASRRYGRLGHSLAEHATFEAGVAPQRERNEARQKHRYLCIFNADLSHRKFRCMKPFSLIPKTDTLSFFITERPR